MDWCRMPPVERKMEWERLSLEEQHDEVMRLLENGEHVQSQALLSAFYPRGDRQANKRAMLLDLFDRQDRKLFQSLVEHWLPSPDPLLEAAGVLNSHRKHAPKNTQLLLMILIDELMRRRT